MLQKVTEYIGMRKNTEEGDRTYWNKNIYIYIYIYIKEGVTDCENGKGKGEEIGVH